MDKRADGLGEWTYGCGATKAGCGMCRGAGGWRTAAGWNDCPCKARWTNPKPWEQAIARSKEPDRFCTLCGGRGGARAGGRWIRCECMKTTAAERKLRKNMNEIGVAHPSRQKTLF
jgi:hypothetical protein